MPVSSCHIDDRSLRDLLQHPVVVLFKSLLKDGSPHLVGGCIRDRLSGHKGSDLDFATSYPPETVSSILSAHGIRVVETGLRHGTVTAVVDSGHYEITQFRKANSIEGDLGERDFTINALALSLLSGALLDPYDGKSDLQNNILRGVGNPLDRFNEDPLRILRMVRFGPAAGRTAEQKTVDAAISVADKLAAISPERIREELSKIIIAPHAGSAFTFMRDKGLFQHFLPEIIPSIGFEQNEFHIHDVFEHTVWVMERTDPEKLILRLTGLFHDLGKPHTLSIGADGRRHFYEHEIVSAALCEEAMTRLKFSNKDIARTVRLVKLHMRPIDCGPTGVRRLMRDLEEDFVLWREFKTADSPPALGDDDFGQRAVRFDTMVQEELARRAKSKEKGLAVSGTDIMNLGVSEGPHVGKTLDHLKEIVLEDPERNDRDGLLIEASQFLTKHGFLP